MASPSSRASDRVLGFLNKAATQIHSHRAFVHIAIFHSVPTFPTFNLLLFLSLSLTREVEASGTRQSHKTKDTQQVVRGRPEFLQPQQSSEFTACAILIAIDTTLAGVLKDQTQGQDIGLRTKSHWLGVPGSQRLRRLNVFSEMRLVLRDL